MIVTVHPEFGETLTICHNEPGLAANESVIAKCQRILAEHAERLRELWEGFDLDKAMSEAD
jgi:hypothetical protein